jgi:ribonuclease HI
MNMNKYILHTDGGARGNPGPAAVGAVIEGDEIGRVELSEYIGETTNNDAEYQAAIRGLKKLKSILGGKVAEAEVLVNADSELMVKQMNREYKVKDKNLQVLFMELWNLCMEFNSVIFFHVRREQNAGADALVNAALDLEASKLKI